MSSFTPLDHQFMGRALVLARRGLHTTDPNPRVGCVLVRDGEVVGEGWHLQAGQPHAEVHALRAAGERAAVPPPMSPWNPAAIRGGHRPVPMPWCGPESRAWSVPWWTPIRRCPVVACGGCGRPGLKCTAACWKPRPAP